MWNVLTYTGKNREESWFQKAISHWRYKPRWVISLSEARAWREIESWFVKSEKDNIAWKIVEALQMKQRSVNSKQKNNVIYPEFSQKQSVWLPEHSEVIPFPRKVA